jgi:alpha-glucoside transport system substrate-binding protein
MDFQQAEKRFKQLKAQFEAGTLTETEFKTQLEELMVQDERGDWWMIGYETERWYRHDGTNWVQADPPGKGSQDSTAREKAEQEQHEREKAKEAGVLHYKGMLAQKEGKYDEAERLYRQSLAIAVDLKDEPGKANILHQLTILTQERLDSEKKERENTEKAARAKAEREAAERAAREKAKQEAERAAREKSEREAAEKASQKAEREAAEKATREQAYKQPPAQSAPAVQPSKPKTRIWIAYGAIILVGIVLCSAVGIWIFNNFPGLPAPATEPPPAAEEPVIPEVGFAVMPGGALEQAIQGAFAGTTITVDGAFEGNDPDGVKFDQSMQAFEDATGITVNYIGNKEFEGSISIRVDAGDAPDIVDFPQPGLFAHFVRSGNIVPVTNFISDEWLSQQYNPGWREFNTVDGVEAGVMHRYSGKSLVWYPKAAWDAAGYQVPQTWDELLGLTYRILEDGGTPWCIGIESGAATGWVATDWTEDLMLRTTSLENYDAWVAGDLPFDSGEVKNAIFLWSEIWFDDALVYGGRSSILSTFFGDSATPMFEDPPQCWMHRQANFITSFFPGGVTYGVDYDFFYLPPVDESYGRPFLVAGDLIAMFNDRPEVRALMEYFTTPQSVSGWLEGGGAIAAQQTATQDMYGSDLDWGVSQLVAGATSFRFDGSDLMPGEVGAGSFWEHITSYVAGYEDLDTAMQEIDASWPR